MTVSTLQKRAVDNIPHVTNVEILEKINKLIDQDVYVLSEHQLELLKEADDDLKNGRFIDGDEMDRRVEKWLSER